MAYGGIISPSTQRDPTSDAKKLEFARLFNLFEHLTSSGRAAPCPLAEKNRKGASRNTPTDASRPSDKKTRSTIKDSELSSLVAKCKKLEVHDRDTHATHTSTPTRPRRNTLASMNDVPTPPPAMQHQRQPKVPPAIEDVDDQQNDDPAPAKSNLPDQYPFTFKLMLHNLYDADDWVRTVQEVLEKSKVEFKPLAEQETVPTTPPGTARKEGDGSSPDKIRFNLDGVVGGPTPGGARGRRASLSSVHRRSQSIGGPKAGPLSPLSPSFGPIHETSRPPEVRVVKKRCVGRRKSMSIGNGASIGLPPTGSPSAQPSTAASPHTSTIAVSNWVYEAATSATERPASVAFATLPPPPPPSPTGGSFSESSSLLGGGMMMMGGSKPDTYAAARRKRVSVDLRDSNPQGFTLTPLQNVTNGLRGERLLSRRRKLSSGFQFPSVKPESASPAMVVQSEEEKPTC